MRLKLICAAFLLPILANAQQSVPLNDMSFWKKQEGGNNWQTASGVTADSISSHVLKPISGTGVLVNMNDKVNKANLLSIYEHGDIDVSFDFLMAGHSNSGFYLQGRYEVQLLDSWGVKVAKDGDCGGIYRRRRLPDGFMYEGHAPRQNACLAPGLWQHFDISFQAPRFDATGKKIANAKIIKIVLNGVLLHENVELTGPTGGPISESEAAKGPFMIQGDHGPVAFRNIKYMDILKTPELSAIKYKAFFGKFNDSKAFLSKKPDETGVIDKLNWDICLQQPQNEYAEVFNAALKVPQAGKYTLMMTAGGKSSLSVDGKVIFLESPTANNARRSETVSLPAGDLPLELIMYKSDAGIRPILGLWLSGSNIRTAEFHNLVSIKGNSERDPIFMDAKESTVFRSFVDIKNGNKTKRVVHAVNVGSPEKVHYTYDLDNATVVQVWKGDFLNTAPMWDKRGDGSSKANGTTIFFDNTPTVVNQATKLMLEDSIPDNAQYRSLGYDLTKDGLPIFRYQMYGADIEDLSKVTDNGKSLTRTISVKKPVSDLSVRVAVAKKFTVFSDDIYIVDDKSYYIKLLNGAKPTIEKVGEYSVMILPLKDKVQYAILR